MLTIGDKMPRFDVSAVVSTDPDKAFERITSESAQGKWKVVFFWPKDFTFVCPTEIAAFGKLNSEIRFVSVNDLNVGRNPAEVLRVLDALQTDELCPCNWQKGDAFLKAA